MLSPDSVELADLAAGWRSAYLHIPFCRRRCPYCDFAVVAPGDAVATDLPTLSESYLEALHAEIDMEPDWEPLDAVNFGGGTPSYLSEKQLRRLVERLEANISWDKAEEVTFECEPGTLSEPKVHALRELGVTRLSLGVELYAQRQRYAHRDDKSLRESGTPDRTLHPGLLFCP